jgi:hypothetical protein
MKKINLLVVMLAITFCSVMAQNSSLTDKITISQTSINVNKQDIELPDEAVGYLSDPEGNMIALDCIDPKTAKKKRPKHVLKVYRLVDKKLMWSKNYKPETTHYKFLKQGIMEINDMNIILLNNMKGTEIWKKNLHFIGIIDDKLIAHSGSDFGEISLDSYIGAYNIENGEKIWLNKMNAKYGVSYNQPIDNNNDYIISNNLYRINWTTGNMIQLKSNTGTDAPPIGEIYIPFITANYFGYVFIKKNYNNYRNYNEKFRNNDRQMFMTPSKKVSGMHSNIVSKDGVNYYADLGSFKCFDDSLKLVYKTKTNVRKGSASELILKNDTAYVVNLGYGIYPKYGKRFVDFPYIASFNIKDGKALDNKRLAYDSVTIASTCVNDTCIRMLFYNREAEYRFADRYWSLGDRDTSKVGQFVCYLTDKMCYTKNDNNSFSEIKSTEEYTPVLTTRGYIVDITEREPKVIAKKENTYFQVAQINNAYFYQGGKNENELWYFNSGQATLIADDVKQVLQNNDKLEILTTAGKARIISLGI